MAGRDIAIVGGGPAGLMAAEAAAGAGARVTIYDQLPSVGRKLLIAGKGGLNLTHSEPLDAFRRRYGARQPEIERLLAVFGPAEVRAWAAGLGIPTVIGSSGRVFPHDLRAAPLLRAWLRRLRALGVSMAVRHRWCGWTSSGSGALCFATPEGRREVAADRVVLALGGASWPRLGADGGWVASLAAQGIAIAPLRPANCGFERDWSGHFAARHAGEPIKPLRASLAGSEPVAGELVITDYGVEGGVVYALSAGLRTAIERAGHADLVLDLAPGRSHERLSADLARSDRRRSVAERLRRAAQLAGAKAGLLREVLPRATFEDPAALARAIKALPLRLRAPRPLAEAISTAGGVPFEALDERLMLRAVPDTHCAGEMLDWEAPTGGYLLTACLASGRVAGLAAASR